MGDVSIDLLRQSPSCNAPKLLSILETVHLSQLISEPTRVSVGPKTLIDHVYVSRPQTIANLTTVFLYML